MPLLCRPQPLVWLDVQTGSHRDADLNFPRAAACMYVRIAISVPRPDVAWMCMTDVVVVCLSSVVSQLFGEVLLARWL